MFSNQRFLTFILCLSGALTFGIFATAANAQTGDKAPAAKSDDALPAEIPPSQKRWYNHYKNQENISKPSETLLNTDAEPELTEGFESLFNGTDLTGWTPKGGTCSFEVVDGMIKGTCIPGSNSTYLCTDREDFSDFIFTCDVKWEVDGNTGVMFRAKLKDSKKAKENNDATKVVYGPQFELEGFEKKRFWSGGIYGQSCGGYFYPVWLKKHEKARTPLKEDWNRATIEARGNVVKTWLNGIPVAHWVGDGTYDAGYFGLQVHKGTKGTMFFKNIKVKEISK